MGRNRKFNKNIPAHINQSQLPSGCYWDNRDSIWYTVYKKPNGKNGRKRIAGEDALLSELHRIIEVENGIDRETFSFLADKYFESESYKKLVNKKNHENSYVIICEYQTKIKKKLSEISIKLWDDGLVQKLIDKIGKNRGATTARLLNAFIRRVFQWNLKRGNCAYNPALRTELPAERQKQTYPSHRAYYALLNHAKKNGTYKAKFPGSCAHYIWMVMEFEYLCRQRGIETRTMTDKDVSDIGIETKRRKRSRTNITEWNDRLQAVTKAAQDARQEIYKAKGIATPLKAKDRPLIVNTLGETLKKEAYGSAWQRFITSAIKTGVINESERFSLHDLKRKGVTDTKGTDDEKLKASGHRDPKMLTIYDKAKSIVKPASE